MIMRIVTLMSIIAAMLMATRPAAAWIQFCSNVPNQTLYTGVVVASTATDPPLGCTAIGEPYVKGWTALHQGQCAMVASGDVKNDYQGAFGFVATINGQSDWWDQGNDGGQRFVCEQDGTFTSGQWECSFWGGGPILSQCGNSNAGVVSYPVGWESANYDNFTLTFN